MPLIINKRGKLEEVIYSPYEKLWISLVAAQKKYWQLIDKQTTQIMTSMRRKKVE